MIDAASLEKELKSKVADQTKLRAEGLDRFRVLTPFVFDDGDHLAIVLKKEGEHWYLSDEGHTFMHLSYRLSDKDLKKGTRQKVIANILSSFNLTDRDGELLLPVPKADYGNALFTFTQALIKLSDITFLSRERVKSTFVEDFSRFFDTAVPAAKKSYNWFDVNHDQQGHYKVDCRIIGKTKPLFVFGVTNDAKAKDATINLLQFEKWGLDFSSLAIFEDQEQINTRALAKLTDVCEKQFSNLSGNKDRIQKYLEQIVH